MSARFRDLVFNLSHLSIAMMMIVAIHVHQHPNVPSEVLPIIVQPVKLHGYFATTHTLTVRGRFHSDYFQKHLMSHRYEYIPYKPFISYLVKDPDAIV